jgi:hypothetical protein
MQYAVTIRYEVQQTLYIEAETRAEAKAKARANEAEDWTEMAPTYPIEPRVISCRDGWEA